MNTPERIKKLPTDEHGRPVPWFVEWIDGKPDFRIADARKIPVAYHQQLCWVCGQRLGKYKAFLIGPMCAVNRTTAEPPCHKDCALFSAQACPFLATPKMHRRKRDLPEDYQAPAGEMLERNPGVTLVWVTLDFKPFWAGNGSLFHLGRPEEVLWFCEGRAATHAEIMDSISSGLPALERLAFAEGPAAVSEFNDCVRKALELVPGP